MKTSVIGAGAWGTALAIHLGKLYPTKLWARNSGHVSGMKKAQSNPLYLGNFKFPSLLNIEDDISTLTYRNIGETKQYGASYFGSIRFNKFTFRGSLNLYQYTGRDASLGFDDWTDPVLLYSYSVGGNVKLGNDWKAETFGFFRSPSQSLQGSTTTFSMMSFGIKKTFKNKRGSLGIRVIEPFKANK